jgi:hypothetical protein
LFSLNGKTAPDGPPRLDAQVLATALSVYVTNSSLAGTTAASYGFHVTSHGLGTRTFNVQGSDEAFGVCNNSSISVMDLLLAVNAYSRNGLLFDFDGNGSLSAIEIILRILANLVFDAINDKGSI